VESEDIPTYRPFLPSENAIHVLFAHFQGTLLHINPFRFRDLRKLILENMEQIEVNYMRIYSDSVDLFVCHHLYALGAFRISGGLFQIVLSIQLQSHVG
jgi:hypothetical protein